MGKRALLILFFLTIIGAFLRFYNLSWGNGFFFHPDERNIASAVLNIHFPDDSNPNFFAYGSLPIYLTYAIGALLTFLTKTNWLEFEHTILIGRAISATLSTLMIPLVYMVTKIVLTNNKLRITNNEISKRCSLLVTRYSLLVAMLVAFTPGLIQYAHFSTFEIILTFEYLLSLYFALKIAKVGRWRDYIFCALVLGASVATKVTSGLIVPILPLAHLFHRWSHGNLLFERTPSPSRWKSRTLVFKLLDFARRIKTVIYDPTTKFMYQYINAKLIASILLVLISSFILSPYNILDYSAFRHSMNYEGGVATGSMPVFYTAQFIETIPFWYQITQVFPYILGWPMTVASFLAWIYLLINSLRHSVRKTENDSHFLLFTLRLCSGQASYFLLFLILPTPYFLFHGALFVKWTRYMIPLIPSLAIIAIVGIYHLLNSMQANIPVIRYSLFVIGGIFVLLTAVQGISFFTIYLQPDTRVAAAQWAAKNIPPDAKILSEIWDLGITPFNTKFPTSNIKLFDFYELDGDPRVAHELARMENESRREDKLNELAERLEESEYIIIPSQRIYKTRLRLPEHFPLGARYYQTLFDGTLGFEKIAEFDSFPTFSLPFTDYRLPMTDDNAEETFKVFDHPKVMIFRKVRPLTQTQYSNLLTSDTFDTSDDPDDPESE